MMVQSIEKNYNECMKGVDQRLRDELAAAPLQTMLFIHHVNVCACLIVIVIN